MKMRVGPVISVHPSVRTRVLFLDNMVIKRREQDTLRLSLARATR